MDNYLEILKENFLLDPSFLIEEMTELLDGMGIPFKVELEEEDVSPHDQVIVELYEELIVIISEPKYRMLEILLSKEEAYTDLQTLCRFVAEAYGLIQQEADLDDFEEEDVAA